MNEVIDAFHRQIPGRSKRSGRGWITFDCPACGDHRGRAGFLETPTGGFRYRCQNGGCRYERGTRWEPDTQFGGRARRLFEIMGGSITDIPEKFLKPQIKTLAFDNSDPDSRHAWVTHMLSEDWSDEAMSPHTRAYEWLKRRNNVEVALDFPEVPLPRGWKLLDEAKTSDAADVRAYVNHRCATYAEGFPFMWSPQHRRHVIVPLVNKETIVGWVARAVDRDAELRHIKCPNFPTDYMFGQDLRYRYKIVLVMQGVFDALALNGLCTFGSVISKKQANLLNQLASVGKQIVLIPDQKSNEWTNYWEMAKQNGWHLSVPEWPGDDRFNSVNHIKDPGESIEVNGRLRTIEVVMDSITDAYLSAEIKLRNLSR